MEFIMLGTKQNLSKIHVDTVITIGSDKITPATSVRNLEGPLGWWNEKHHMLQ